MPFCPEVGEMRYFVLRQSVSALVFQERLEGLCPQSSLDCILSLTLTSTHLSPCALSPGYASPATVCFYCEVIKYMVSKFLQYLILHYIDYYILLYLKTLPVVKFLFNC